MWALAASFPIDQTTIGRDGLTVPHRAPLAKGALLHHQNSVEGLHADVKQLAFTQSLMTFVVVFGWR